METPQPSKETARLYSEAIEQADMAFRLLQIQQRLDAWDRLYNEEISELHRAIAEMKLDYVRQFEARRPAIKSPRWWTATRTHPREP